MRVTWTSWRGKPKEMDLDEALRPALDMHDGGAVEQARDLAGLNAEVIGRLAALLVEKGVLTLDEAALACEAGELKRVE